MSRLRTHKSLNAAISIILIRYIDGGAPRKPSKPRSTPFARAVPNGTVMSKTYIFLRRAYSLCTSKYHPLNRTERWHVNCLGFRPCPFRWPAVTSPLPFEVVGSAVPDIDTASDSTFGADRWNLWHFDRDRPTPLKLLAAKL